MFFPVQLKRLTIDIFHKIIIRIVKAIDGCQKSPIFFISATIELMIQLKLKLLITEA